MKANPTSAAADRETAEATAPAARATPGTGAEYLQLQRMIGNRAAQQALQRGMFDSIKKALGMKYVADVSGEQVIVGSKAEETEAAGIIDRVEQTYGVDVSAMKGAKATRDHYSSAAKAVREKVKAIPWKIRELRAVERALKHFAPILGKERVFSTRGHEAQEVSAVGKVNTSITENTATGAIDPDTLGEFYRSDGTFALYKSSETYDSDFPGDLDKQLEGTITHEIAHGVMRYCQPQFTAVSGFWLDDDRKSNDPAAEAPPTGYGKKNAREDMCESVMMYFVAESRLKTSCPKRHALIESLVNGWIAPKGDFMTPGELPKGDTPTEAPTEVVV